MPTPPLSRDLIPHYLQLAEKHKTVKDMAAEDGIHKATLKSRLLSLGIFNDVKVILAGGQVSRESVEPERVEPGAPDIVGATADVDSDIERIRRETGARFAAKDSRSKRKKHQKIYFTHGAVCIFFVGDTHFGNAGTDSERAFAEQDDILATPGAYVWFQGDLLDNFVVGKLTAENFKESLSINDQWRLGKFYLERFADRLIAVTSGNHDQFTRRMIGVDYARDICPDGILYDSDEVQATIRVGNKDFRIWSRHQFRGNSLYNPSHAIERAARFSSARWDVYVQGHVHRGAMSREFVLDGERKLALLSGSYKEFDDYARERGFEQNDASTAVALVLHDDGTYWATGSIKCAQNYMKAIYRG